MDEQNKNEEPRKIELEGFDPNDLIGGDEVQNLSREELNAKLWLMTQCELVGFAIEREGDCQNGACGKIHTERIYTNNPIAWVVCYQNAIQDMRDEGIMNRAVKLLMLSYPLPPYLSDEQMAQLTTSEQIAPRVTQMAMWIGKDNIDPTEADEFLKSIGGDGK